jgi:pimeloyl-ACP methyl ester carboxylesterase
MIKKILIGILSLLLIVFTLIFVFGYESDLTVDELKASYGQSPSEFIEIEGMQVHYRIEGSGPTLVLLHGTASSLHTWNGWAEVLQDSFRVVRMDLPAYGLTGPHPEAKYNITDYVDFVDRFLEALSIDEFALAGNSLGGGIAWNYAISHPEKVKQLILVDASGVPKNGSSPIVFRLAKNKILAPILKRITPKSFIQKNIEQVYFDDSKVTIDLVDRYYNFALRTGNRQAFIDRSRQVYTMEINNLKSIECPTLILWGQHDEWIPVEDAQVFKSEIKDSQLIIYENSGHVPMEEIPNETAQDAREFLNSKVK